MAVLLVMGINLFPVPYDWNSHFTYVTFGIPCGFIEAQMLTAEGVLANEKAQGHHQWHGNVALDWKHFMVNAMIAIALSGIGLWLTSLNKVSNGVSFWGCFVMISLLVLLLYSGSFSEVLNRLVAVAPDVRIACLLFIIGFLAMYPILLAFGLRRCLRECGLLGRERWLAIGGLMLLVLVACSPHYREAHFFLKMVVISGQ